MKPTRHTYPMSGVIALAPSLDVAGFLTRTALDQAVAWDAWHGSDLTRLCESSTSPLQGLRIGVPQGLWLDPSTGQATHAPQIQACFEQALSVLKAEGAQFVQIPMPPQYQVVHAANTIIAFEAFQQLQHIWRDYPDHLGEGLQKKLEGAADLSLNHYHAERVKADVWQHDLNTLFSNQVDVLMWPGREALPETVQTLMERPTAQRSACNRLLSLTGHPALTCPMGVSQEGLPMALQIGAAMHDEPRLMAVAHAFEKAIAWQLPALMN